MASSGPSAHTPSEPSRHVLGPCLSSAPRCPVHTQPHAGTPLPRRSDSNEAGPQGPPGLWGGGDLPEADWGRGGHQPGRGPSGARPGGRTVLRWRGDGNLPLGRSLRSLPGQLQIPSQCHSCAQGQPVDFSPPSSRPPVQTRNQEGWPRPPLLAGRPGPAVLGISGRLPCGG